MWEGSAFRKGIQSPSISFDQLPNVLATEALLLKNGPMRGLFLCLFIASALSVYSENWPAWRGPRLDGTSLEQNVPLKWSREENIAWKTPLPGQGHASPIVWNNRIFTETALLESMDRCLLCVDRKDGRILWQRTV